MKNILLLLSLFVAISLSIHTLFDGNKGLQEYNLYTQRNIIETIDLTNMRFACERLVFLGGKRYKKLLAKEESILTSTMLKDAVILFPDEAKKKKVERELRSIFWYSWWLKKRHITKHFWASAIFTAIDNQSYYPKQAMKSEFIYNRYYHVL